MGAVAMRMVIKMINKEPLEDKTIELPYKIVERDSVIER
jgi:LacI family transcriptional regulator